MGEGEGMMSASSMASTSTDEHQTEELTGEGVPMHSGHDRPLPGLFDFIGAHIGGELAEEIWR
jgi:hypothetical protein